MSRWESFWSWFVFLGAIGGYVPMVIGGWQHPADINVASYALWFVLSSTFLYSIIAQRQPGWRLPLGWIVGNVAMIVLGLARGGYTFNLGPAESIALFGLVLVIGTWAAVGTVTKRWNARILYLGSVAVDIVSFYPQLKQYLLPHDPPSGWTLIGWCLFFAGAALNLFAVERFVHKLVQKKQKALLTLEQSALSLENSIFIAITALVMYLA